MHGAKEGVGVTNARQHAWESGTITVVEQARLGLGLYWYFSYYFVIAAEEGYSCILYSLCV